MTGKAPAAIAVQNFKVPPQREETVLHIRNDARVGGQFSYKVCRGDNEIDHVGK